jgi:hypothetical protein
MQRTQRFFNVFTKARSDILDPSKFHHYFIGAFVFTVEEEEYNFILFIQRDSNRRILWGRGFPCPR